MQFKFHLFVQKHHNRTYTVVPLPFFELTAFGINLEEIKLELSEALVERIQSISPQHLHQLEYESSLNMSKVYVEIRPVDRKNNKKRREKMRLMFSVLIKKEDDGQLHVTVPKVGNPPLTFYVYEPDELQEVAAQELFAWLDGYTLEDLMEYRHARSESLDSLEVEVELKKPKEVASPNFEPDLEQRFWALREVGINMTAQIAEGRFRKTYRRDDVVEDMLYTLTNTRHNSILLTGPSETGKSAVVHEVVRRIHKGDCAQSLQDRQVWMLTPDRMIAGAQYIGTWEERLKDIVSECRQHQHILYVEDLPGLIEIGRWSKSDQNVAQALKPYIESGEVILIGETSDDRLRMAESMAPGFINLFRTVRVEPMSEDETLSVLGYVARDIEREMEIRLEPTSIEASVELSRRFWPYRSFPGKAVRLLESAAADVAKQRSGFMRPVVRRPDVIRSFTQQSGMPEFIISDDIRLEFSSVEEYFQTRILGQQAAVQQMVDLVTTIKAGLNDPEKPLGTFLFIGPTGVGKTQLAKTLAAYLFGDEARMLRFDMSEYVGVDGVARLIGAFNTEGELTQKMREQPFCVLLLDEFEKADPRIYDIFLQVLGEGRLTGANGRTTFFHNAIIIMTSNLGAEQRAFRSPGFVQEVSDLADQTVLADHYRTKVQEYFRPEFINRIDHIVTFTQLSRDALRQIAARELREILMRDGITRRNSIIEIDDTVIDLVLVKGFSPAFGARPLKREIERLVVSPMARALAERSPRDQILLRIFAEDNQLAIKSVPIDEAVATTTVALTGAMDGGRRFRVKLDGPGMVEAFAELRRELSEWQESETYREMLAERESLLSATNAPDFWDDGDRARDMLTRFYFLDRLLRRLKQLYEKAEYLEDFAILVNRERDSRYQSELATDYEELYNNVSFLCIELLTAHLPHRNQAMMLISPLGMGGPKDDFPHEAWPRRLSALYLRWAERKGYDHALYLLDNEAGEYGKFQKLTAGNFKDLMKRFSQRPATDEIAIFLQGTNVFGFLKGERGVHRLAGRDSTQDEHTRIQVFAIPDGTDIPKWLADYQKIKHEIATGERQAPPAEKHSVVRSYMLERSEKYIRDMRTGVRVHKIREFFNEGLLDDFILAYLESDEVVNAWEDRFPPTFPF